MCGIAGVFKFNRNNGIAITQSLLETMRDTMVHRGPDGAGVYLDGNCMVGLAHRRLAIVDLSDSAKQPMSNEDATIWVVFNGEIYNHREIKKELEELGTHHWKTDHSDTEVILHSYEQWGIECIKKFRGMFAFALWDERRKELYLVRDRIGVKPLYYIVQDNAFIAFASEIKALLKLPGYRARVDEYALYNYLSFLTTPAPSTLFANICKLSPGCFIKVNQEGVICKERYWDVLDNLINLNTDDEDELAKGILNELNTAVQLRKMSDVPIGVFLSGGIESSTNAALFSQGETQIIHTFSIGYSGNIPEYEKELEYAAFMANKVNAQHIAKRLTIDDLNEFLKLMVYHQDEPNADPVCFPIYAVSKLARENGVIVCQVGEGADELFYGYPAWKRAFLFQKVFENSFTRFAARTFFTPILKVSGKQDRFLCEYVHRAGSGQPVFWGGAESFNHFEKSDVFSEKFLKGIDGYTSWEVIAPLYQRFCEKAQSGDWLNWMTYIDLNFRLPELLLMRVDKMSMAVSLEARVPFLDHKFVELAFSIPSKIKFKNRKLKYLLKKAVRNVIPEEIINRKKQGFSVPLFRWLYEEELYKKVKSSIALLKDTGIFNSEKVDQILSNRHSSKVWTLFVLAEWWKKFIVKQ